MESRDILIYLSMSNNGDWQKIYEKLQTKTYDYNEHDVIETLSKNKCKVLTLLDEDYPNYLKSCFKPPFVLYYYGDISLISDLNRNLGVIGTRKASVYGMDMTSKLVTKLAPKYNIVSGMAKGIDGVAHFTAINSKGKTIAVLGSGIDNCYPPENKDIYRAIKKDHLLISEYPLNVEPESKHFPERNRLIAYFSKGLLVTEAYERSGTAITVGYALRSGKEVMCIPYRANENSLCNILLREGAFMVQSEEDVLDCLNYENDKNVKDIL